AHSSLERRPCDKSARHLAVVDSLLCPRGHRWVERAVHTRDVRSESASDGHPSSSTIVLYVDSGGFGPLQARRNVLRGSRRSCGLIADKKTSGPDFRSPEPNAVAFSARHTHQKS